MKHTHTYTHNYTHTHIHMQTYSDPDTGTDPDRDTDTDTDTDTDDALVMKWAHLPVCAKMGLNVESLHRVDGLKGQLKVALGSASSSQL